MRRRDFVTALAAGPVVSSCVAPCIAQTGQIERKGHLKQCVTQGVFGRGMNFEDSCREAARLGCKGYDLRGPAD